MNIVNIATGSVITATGMLASAEAVPSELSYLKPILESGSFGLIVIAALLFMLKVIPAFIAYLEKRDDKFMLSLEAERKAREASNEKHIEALGRLSDSIERKLDK